MRLNDKEPPPIQNDSTPIFELIIADIRERAELGKQKYGVTLQAHNGCRPLIDLYQELLDAIQYIRQEIEERSVNDERLATEVTEIAYRIMPEDMTIPVRPGDTWHEQEREEVRKGFLKFLSERRK